MITGDGRDRVTAMRAVRRTALNSAMSDWTDDELWTLVRLLGRFVTATESVIFAPDAGGCAGPDGRPLQNGKGPQ